MKIEILVKNYNLGNNKQFCKYLAKTNGGIFEVHFRKECGLPPEKHCIIECEQGEYNVKQTQYFDKNGEKRQKYIIWIAKWKLTEDTDKIVAEIEEKRKIEEEQKALDFLANSDI